MKRRITALALCSIMAISALAGCGTRGAATTTSTTAAAEADDSDEDAAEDTASESTGEAEYSIRVGHVLADTHPYEYGLLRFAELVSEKTNGAVEVDVFANSQLGNERDMIEGLQLGTLEMCLVSTAPLSGFTDDFLVFDLPYIFTTTEEARATVDSEIGQEMLDALESQGIIGLGYFENGFRHVTNSTREIVHPSDLQGLKIRTMENSIQMATFSAMGADPTPMAFGELFTALQQGTIDAQENPLAIIDTSKFYEVQDYLSLTSHFYAPTPVLMSKSFYDTLPEEYQIAIQEAVDESKEYERGLLDEMNERLLDEIAEYGVTITEIDFDEFSEAVQPVYDEYIGDGDGMVSEEIYNRVQEFLSTLSE